MDNSIKNAIFISGTFAAGMLSGALLTSNPVSKIPGSFINKSKSILLKERQCFDRMIEKMRQELTNPVPDLFKATESLSLSEEELFHG